MTDRPQNEKVDFDKLKRERDEALSKMLKTLAEDFAKRIGCDPEEVHTHVSNHGSTEECYCACASGGPCQHEWGGWREFEDGNGGEQFCQRCGMGIMSHDMWLGE